MAETHEVTAEIEGMGLQASYFRRKVYALLKDFHFCYFFLTKFTKVHKGPDDCQVALCFTLWPLCEIYLFYFFQSLVLRAAPVKSEITISAMRSPVC